MLPVQVTPTVVLLHGLARSRLAMLPLAWSLRRAGLSVVNVGYAGLRRPLPETVEDVTRRLDAALEGTSGPVSFVTHSLGGILARAYLAGRPRPGSRLVQLAPPNQGARLAESLRGRLLARGVFGAALDGLGVEQGGLRFRTPPLDGVEVGVIAGGRGGPRGFGPWLPEDNDMVVCVRETFLPEARDWILVPHVHTFIMNAPAVHAQVLSFLGAGAFSGDAKRLVRAGDGEVTLRP